MVTQLADGQVLDYTKDGIPYMDERFLSSNAEPAEAPRPAQLQPELSSIDSNRTHSPRAVWVSDRTTAPATNPHLTQSGYDNAQIELLPAVSQPLIGDYFPLPHVGDVSPQPAWTPLPQVDHPLVQPLIWETGDVTADVYAAVLARKEALESLETKSEEIRATIKTLDWVLETITKKRTYCAANNE